MPTPPLPALDGISPVAWEHPADRAALDALRALPGFDQLVRLVYGRLHAVQWAAGTGRHSRPADPATDARLVGVYGRVCAVLDVPPAWGLHVIDSDDPNAAAHGVDPPRLLVTSALVDLLDDDELAAVLAHELAHVLSDHVLYKTMLRVLISVGWLSFAVPMAPLVFLGVFVALQEWDRRSELSADRCAALVTGGPEVPIRALRKVHAALEAGGRLPPWQQPAADPPSGDADSTSVRARLDAAMRQAAHLVLSGHPMTGTREAELRAWFASGAPQRILDGAYPRRQADPRTSPVAPPWEGWSEPAAQVRAAIEQGLVDAQAASGPALDRARAASSRAAAQYGEAVAWLRRKVED